MKTKVSTPEKTGGTPFKSRGRDPFGIQPKLFVNNPGDKHEAEADHAADRIVHSGKPSVAPAAPAAAPVQLKEDDEVVQQKPIAQTVTPYIQRKSDQMGEADITGIEDKMGNADLEQRVQRKEEEERVQKKEEDESAQMKEEDDSAQMKEEEESVQKKEEDDSAQMKEEDDSAQMKEDDEGVQAKLQPSKPAPAPSTVGRQLKDSKGQGSPLPTDVRSKMETGFGADFSNVKIHTGSAAVNMNKSLGAKAFTNKGDIYFNQGKFNPASKDGEFLLAHELTHTLQQGAAKPKTENKPVEKAIEKKEDKKIIIASPETGAKKETDAKARESAVQAPPKLVPVSTSSGNGSMPESTAPAPAIPVAGAVPAGPASAADPAAQPATPEAAPAEEKKKPSPKDDPNFLAVTENIAETADEESEHQPAGELSEDAQEAAPSPGNERESIAQAGQVDEMEEAEPKPFSAEGFKAKLMEKIAGMQLPENQEQAAEFDKNNNIDQVNQAAVGDVNAEKSAAAGPVEQTSKAAPNTNAVPPRKTVPLKGAKPGPKPGPVGAAKAVPQKRGDGEVNQPLQEQTSQIDSRMAESNVTDDQLAKSNEPKFQEALDSKKTAKSNAETAPAAFRQKEDATLQTSAAKSEATSQEQLAGMHQVRSGAFTKVLGKQKGAGTKDTSEREKIAGHINGIYEKTKSDVTTILDTLEEKVTKRFEYFSNIAKKAFEDYVAVKMILYKAKRYGGIDGPIWWTRDLFMGLPDEVNQFFVDGKKVFVKAMDVGITNVANLVAGELNRAKSRIERGKTDVNKYVDSLPKNLKHLGKEAAEEIQDKFSQLQDDVNSKEESLVDSLAQQYMEALDEVDARIEEMKEANKGLVDAAMGFINGVIETIKKLSEMITKLFAAISSVIGVIMADPLGFMGNLFDGIGKGFDMFKANIQNHLLGGLLEWLTGSLGPMGIVMPKDIFSLSGIFDLVMQVLGLGWDYIRQKAVLILGEPVVKGLEETYDVFKNFATNGIAGLWDFMKEKFSDLKETVIESIKEMLITQVIQAGIKWLLSLLIPGAGFIKAIMAIKDLIVFFVESAMMLIPAITEAILALAAGSVAGVAIAIEKGLAKLISLVINLFAKLIGLGGLSKKVQAIFKKIRKRVDKQVMKILRGAKNKAKRLFGSPRKTVGGKKGKNKNEPVNAPDKQKKINKGLADLNREEKKYLTSEKISREEAENVAKTIKKKHSVFKKFVVVDGGERWNYKYAASPEVVVEGEKKEDGSETETLRFKVGQLIKALYIKGMWVANVSKIDNDDQIVTITFVDKSKGSKNYGLREFKKEVKQGNITTYKKQRKRDYYMGGNPSRDKNSKFGKALRDRWHTFGPVANVSSPVNGSFNDTNGERIWWNGDWISIGDTDLGHYPVDAVTWWNTTGFKYGPRAIEVTDWMKDAKNYRFEESGYNQYNGATSGERYRLPYVDNI